MELITIYYDEDDGKYTGRDREKRETMKSNWHSIKVEGYPTEKGRYQVTIEGVLEDVEGNYLAPGERGVTTADYYGEKAWGLHDGIYRIIAWADLDEPYQGI